MGQHVHGEADEKQAGKARDQHLVPAIEAAHWGGADQQHRPRHGRDCVRGPRARAFPDVSSCRAAALAPRDAARAHGLRGGMGRLTRPAFSAAPRVCSPGAAASCSSVRSSAPARNDAAVAGSAPTLMSRSTSRW